jgi:hypothetical protein
VNHHADFWRLPLRQHLLQAGLAARAEGNPCQGLLLLVLPQAWWRVDFLSYGLAHGPRQGFQARLAYTFGTKTAEFHVCSKCGIVPVVTSTIDGHVHAVVSVNAFENVDSSLLQRAEVSFDGEGQAIAWPGASATGSVVSRSFQPTPNPSLQQAAGLKR